MTAEFTNQWLDDREYIIWFCVSFHAKVCSACRDVSHTKHTTYAITLSIAGLCLQITFGRQ